MNDTQLTTIPRRTLPARPAQREAVLVDGEVVDGWPVPDQPSRTPPLIFAVQPGVRPATLFALAVAVMFGIAAVVILVWKGWGDVVLVAAIIGLAAWVARRMDQPQP